MIVSLVAAMAENRVIGKNGQLPWRLPDEIDHFTKLTIGHTVIMGRKTFDETGRPLPGRCNIVISRNPAFRPEDVTVAVNLEDALALAVAETEVFVIGGGQIFAQALPRAERMYLTEVHAQVDGDAVFPPFDPLAWTIAHETFHPADARHAVGFTMRIYTRAAQ